jgi:SPP1 family predicted phage head-tail adaptor
MLAAGKLTERVVIEQPVEARDASFAAVTRTWQPVATVWAAVEPLQGRELERSRELGSEISLRVRIRHSSAVAAVSSKMRITHGALRYEIQAVLNPLSAGVELHLLCAEFRHG